MTDPVEVMAGAMFLAANGYETDMSPPFNPKSKVGMAWASAQSALSALDAAGFVVLERATLTERLRNWCKKRFGLWITHNTAKGAVAAMLSPAQVKP